MPARLVKCAGDVWSVKFFNKSSSETSVAHYSREDQCVLSLECIAAPTMQTGRCATITPVVSRIAQTDPGSA